MTASGGATGPIVYSTLSDRTGLADLTGATVSGDVAVFIDPDSDYNAVWFWLDDTSQSPPADNSDNASPYDYIGGTTSTATMWDTTTIADGSHTMTVRLRHLDNTIENVTVTFTIDNSSSGFPLWWVGTETGPSSWARPAQTKPISLAALYFQTTGGTEIVSETLYYTFAGELIAMRVDGDLSSIVGDRLGSTSAMYNAATNTVSQRWFEPFGQPRYTTGPIDTDIGFTGQRADAESGLMFYNARYYDPTIGRFISPDSIVPDPANPQDLGRYTYVRNNPANNTDPTGNEPDQTYLCPGIMFGCTRDVKFPDELQRYDRRQATQDAVRTAATNSGRQLPKEEILSILLLTAKEAGVRMTTEEIDEAVAIVYFYRVSGVDELIGIPAGVSIVDVPGSPAGFRIDVSGLPAEMQTPAASKLLRGAGRVAGVAGAIVEIWSDWDDYQAGYAGAGLIGVGYEVGQTGSRIGGGFAGAGLIALGCSAAGFAAFGATCLLSIAAGGYLGGQVGENLYTRVVPNPVTTIVEPPSLQVG